MPTSLVCLFAHPDDEFAVLGRIEQACAQGGTVQVAYLTNGQTPHASAATRLAESVQVLTSLGVPPANIHGAGDALGIPDGRLIRHLSEASAWLFPWLDRTLGVAPGTLPPPPNGPAHSQACVLVPAWEGGHPDHDALHALVCAWAQSRHAESSVWQFPLYNGWRCSGPLFRLMHPLPANGPVAHHAVDWSRARRHLRLALQYPSQWRSWLGLWPALLLHHLRGGGEPLQALEPDRVFDRPHEGPLYYERRAFAQWAEVKAALEAWRQSHDAPQPADRPCALP